MYAPRKMSLKILNYFCQHDVVLGGKFWAIPNESSDFVNLRNLGLTWGRFFRSEALQLYTNKAKL